MSSIGQQVYTLMKERKMKYLDLAEITELKVSDIKNIVHGRSKKPEYIHKIAQAFGILSETLLSTPEDEVIISTNLYMLTIEIIHKELIHFKITHLPLVILQDYIDSVYNFLIEKNEPSSAECYLKGKIETQLKFGIIKNT